MVSILLRPHSYVWNASVNQEFVHVIIFSKAHIILKIIFSQMSNENLNFQHVGFMELFF
jgi:hypothetical protein